MTRRHIKSVILPVAGRGTRLYPLTYHTPKALLEVGGNPLIEYALREAHAANMRTVVLVASLPHKKHFSLYLARARKRFPAMRFHLLFQNNIYGNGKAVLEAKKMVRGHAFGVRYADDFLYGTESVFVRFARIYEKTGFPLMLLQKVHRDKSRHYGVVRVARGAVRPPLYKITDMVEKPTSKLERPPSNLAVTGVYVVTPELLRYLESAEPISPPLTDALTLNVAYLERMRSGRTVYGVRWDDVRIDCGTIQGLTAARKFALRNPS